MCRAEGLVGYIVPSPLLSNQFTRSLREHILNTCHIQNITNFGMDVFHDPTVHTCVIVLRSGPVRGAEIAIRKQVESPSQLAEPHDYRLPQAHLATGPNRTFDIFLVPRHH